ncbi:unnamed protein product [Pieris brassicae]|uniref:Uncharacterized protein n=1 Tax=Pieris brassicae TaxID=7116 RepID=A0A9P0TVT4_PIEBR|nr:unnamed protein product [Pieris brassicae]
MSSALQFQRCLLSDSQVEPVRVQRSFDRVVPDSAAGPSCCGCRCRGSSYRSSGGEGHAAAAWAREIGESCTPLIVQVDSAFKSNSY